MRLVSWNVNGLRACHRKGFMDFVRRDDPDVLCVQETKARPEELPEELLTLPGYHTTYACAERRGYSGVATYAKVPPNQVTVGLGIDRYDREGRVIITAFEDFTLFNVYYPNGQMSPQRLQYKLDFCDAFLEEADARVSRGERLLICGDVNTAHKEIDLARPRENEKTSGFLPVERTWMDRFVSHGFVDTFRLFHPEGGHYTWWSLITRARERDVGWRIDYFFAGENLVDRVADSTILPEVQGSDHCPIALELEP